MGGVELRAEAPSPSTDSDALTVIPIGPTVKFGVIGQGPWGRTVLAELCKLPNAPVVAVCDKYPSALRRGGGLAPKAEPFDDYKKLLDSKDVEAVVIATPTHEQKDIVLAALQAGKHVYCEAPLANDIEDVKAIAQASKAAFKQVFQSGLQLRCHAHRSHILDFMRSGATGMPVLARAQWHRKTSWAAHSPDPIREKEINWRLNKITSTGLMGEVGIHQMDLVTWLWEMRPTAVTGFGAIMSNKDGRDVDDNIQAMFEFSDGRKYLYDASLSNSFDSEYEMLYGTDSAIMMRVVEGGQKAWMFKEVDSAQIGWEVYARKDNLLGETGIVLRAGASTSQKDLGKNPLAADPYPNSPLFYALQKFTGNVGMVAGAVADYFANFGDTDPKALAAQLAGLKTEVVPGLKEGCIATILAIKASEAVAKRERVAINDEMFQI